MTAITYLTTLVKRWIQETNCFIAFILLRQCSFSYNKETTAETWFSRIRELSFRRGMAPTAPTPRTASACRSQTQARCHTDETPATQYWSLPATARFHCHHPIATRTKHTHTYLFTNALFFQITLKWKSRNQKNDEDYYYTFHSECLRAPIFDRNSVPARLNSV